MSKPFLSRDALHDSKHRFELKAGHYPDDILPSTNEEIYRPIVIGENCRIDGVVFGGTVEMRNNSKAMSVYGERVNIFDSCFIGGNVQSSGDIYIGKGVEIRGDVIGDRITIDDSAVIKGNVYSKYNINIGYYAIIWGYVISSSGSIAVGDNSEIFDIISHGNILLGDNVKIIDPVIRSSEGSIQFSNLVVGRNFSVRECPPIVIQDNEINIYKIATKSFSSIPNIPKFQ